MILALFLSMHQDLEHGTDNEWKQQHLDKKGEIVDILQDQWEIMKKHAIDRVKRIAEYYYGTDKARNYGKAVEDNDREEDDTAAEEDESKNAEHLYTIIKYQGKDVLVHIGTGEFTPEVFTRRNVPVLSWFSHSPLPLFVVAAWADEEYKEKNPKRFLDEHAVIYSPKWWQAELRIHHKQREHAINYGDSNGIMQYEDAVLALQNAKVRKLFHSDKVFEKFIDKMIDLKKHTPEEIHTRNTIKIEFLSDNKLDREMYSDREFYHILHTCLLYLSEGDEENIYALIQSFDPHKRVFTHTHHF